METRSLLYTSGTLTLMALSALALAACGHAGNTGTPSVSGPAIGAAESSSDGPKVPFGKQPCQSLTAGELKSAGIAKPKPAKPGREPEKLAFDNTCDFGYLTVIYTTRSDYENQKKTLRSQRQNAPADVPGAFYDVLGNLWFAKDGYYVGIPNTVADADKVKVARAILAKL